MADLNNSLCPICEKSKWFIDKTASKILVLPSKYKVYYCSSCGQRMLYPYLTNSELDAVYSDAYFGSQKNLISDSIPNIELLDTSYVSDLALMRHSKYINSIELMKKLHPKAKSILDVGAATGDFVKIARERGFNAKGIELSQYAIDLAFQLYDIKLEKLNLSQLNEFNSYDIIHLNHVFEHFNNPVQELKYMYNLLDKNGLLYIEIPFQFHFIEKLKFRISKKVSKFTLHSIHHPYFYTPTTITKLFENHGFKIVFLRLFDESRYPVTNRVTRFKKFLWRTLSFFSIGVNIEVFATKVDVR